MDIDKKVMSSLSNLARSYKPPSIHKVVQAFICDYYDSVVPNKMIASARRLYPYVGENKIEGIEELCYPCISLPCMVDLNNLFIDSKFADVEEYVAESTSVFPFFRKWLKVYDDMDVNPEFYQGYPDDVYIPCVSCFGQDALRFFYTDYNCDCYVRSKLSPVGLPLAVYWVLGELACDEVKKVFFFEFYTSTIF